MTEENDLYLYLNINKMKYTTPEQSKKLIKLGLDPNTADMFYCYGMNIWTNEWGYDKEPTVNGEELYMDVGDLPCWSTDGLLGLIKCCTRCEPTLRIDKRWNIFASQGDNVFRSYDINPKGYETLFSAVYELVVWLLENKLITK